MLDKIGLRLRGKLPDKPNFGVADGLDGLLARFLNLTHEQIRVRLRKGGAHAEILDWCFSKRLRPNETQVAIWNAFAGKIGWQGRAAATVEAVRRQSGRKDIATIFDCIDANEGRLAKHQPTSESG